MSIDGGGLTLADTSGVMDERERKYFGIETMKDNFAAVNSMKINMFTNLAMPMWVVEIYKPF